MRMHAVLCQMTRGLAALVTTLVTIAVEAQQAQPTTPSVPLPDPTARQPEPRQPQRLDPLNPTWVKPPAPPAFQGFPVFPSRLSGYGAYPGQGGALPGALPGTLPSGPVNVPLLAPAEPEPPGWPRWVKLQARTPLPYAEDLGLLVRHVDRVWWRQLDEDAFVPLFFHDKFTTLGPGAQVEVRQAGEFELLLHNSTRIVAQGAGALRLVTMNETTVTVAVQSLTRLLVEAIRREHTLVMPDGSKLHIAPPAVDTEPMGPAIVLFERADEPGWLGGRATVFNAGRRDVLWQHAFGETTLAPGQRLTFFLVPPTNPVPGDLVTDGLAMQADGAALRGRASGSAHAAWCGARFTLAAGESLRFDPLQGRPFSTPPAPAAPAKGR